jgi:hypothetical protein
MLNWRYQFVIIIIIIIIIKSEVVPVPFVTKHHAMKAYWGSGGIAPRILWPRHYV